MSSKVKQANFRLPLEYMSMIDDFASRENITKAAVITRALDCMQASYDSGNGGMPVTGSGSGASEQEINDLKNQLKQAEERAQAAEQRANDAVMARDAAEAKARDTATELAAEQAKASLAAAIPQVAPAADTAELDRLKELVAKQEASLEEKTKALAAKEAEVAAKEAQLAERDARITSLSEQLGAANAKAQLASTAQVVSTAPVEGGGSTGADSARALPCLTCLAVSWVHSSSRSMMHVRLASRKVARLSRRIWKTCSTGHVTTVTATQ